MRVHPAEKKLRKSITIFALFHGAEFPMTLSQISKFEKVNAISVNVFIESKSKIVPLFLIDNKRKKHVNLFYVSDGRNEAHFACIKNMARSMNSQLSEGKRKRYICDWNVKKRV